MYDVVIVGGGFAGLTAAMWLGRHRRSAVVVTSGPSRNAMSRAVHGFPGWDGKPPGELLEALREEALRYGAEIVTGIVDRVEKTEEGFTAYADGQPYSGRRILFATGTVDRKPDITNFSEYDGISAWHCPSCDGYEYTGKRIAVLDWGSSMAGYALHFLTYTDQITVITQGNEPEVPPEQMRKLELNGIEVLRKTIVKLEGEEGQIHHLCFEDGSKLACDALFYNIHNKPRLNLIEQLSCQTRSDYVLVDHKARTTIEGAYAAGDIAPLEEMVVVAAGMGAVAAHNIHQSLEPESRRVE